MSASLIVTGVHSDPGERFVGNSMWVLGTDPAPGFPMKVLAVGSARTHSTQSWLLSKSSLQRGLCEQGD